jgi:hypothetical protein
VACETESYYRLTGINRKGLEFWQKKTRDKTRVNSFNNRKLRSFTDLEHLGAANRAGTLGCGAAILHCDLLCVLHLTLRLTLHAVGFHIGPLIIWILVVPHLNVRIVRTAADHRSLVDPTTTF